MAISDKLTYLNTTKGKIKDAINLTNANILSEDTFRSYAEKLKLGLVDIINNGTSDLYDSFPKTTQTGTEIALNNTYEAPMEIGLNGNTHQDTLTGKNLLDSSTINQTTKNGITCSYDSDTQIITLNGTSTTDNNQFAINTNINCDTSGKLTAYYVSGSVTNFAQMRLYNNDWSTQSDKCLVVNLTSLNSSTPIVSNGNLSSSQKFVHNNIRLNTGSVCSNLKFKLMVANSSNTDYEPYTGGTASPSPDYPQDVKVVTGDNTINVHGKNLAKVTNTDIGDTTYSLKISNGLINITTTGSNNSFDLCGGIRTGAWLPTSYDEANDYHLTPANQGTYTLSASNVSATITGTANQTLNIYTNQRRIYKAINYNGTIEDNTFTLQQDEYVKSIYVWTNGNTTINKLELKIQLEQNSQKTEYEPYQSKDYEINLKSKNLLPNNATTQTINGITFTKNEDGSIKVNGTATAQTIYNINESVVLNGTYIITGCPSNGADATYFLQIYGTGGTNEYGNGATTSNINAVVRIVIRNGATVNNLVFKPMIRLASITDDTYEPYYDYKLCKINDYKDKIDKSTGKNLFDKDNVVGGFVNADGTVGGDTNAYRTSDFIPIQPNTAYYKTRTDSPRTKYYDSNKQPLNTTTYQDISIGGNEGTFTTPANACYLRFSYPVASVNANGIMLNEGTTAIPYEPYGEQWYIKKNIGKAVLDGTQNYIKSAYSDTNYCTFITNDFNSLIGNNGQSNLLSNYFISNNIGSSIPNKTGMSYISKDYGLRFAIEYSNANDVAGFQAWLGTHNTIVYYVLNTPTYEIITNETLINQLEELKKAKSVDDKTFISQINEQLPFILDVSALSKN